MRRRFPQRAARVRMGGLSHPTRSLQAELGNVGEVTYRYITSKSTLPTNEMEFLPDQVGVVNPEYNKPGTAPYSRVAVLAWDGKKMTRLSGADRSTFQGMSVQWKRETPLP